MRVFLPASARAAVGVLGAVAFLASACNPVPPAQSAVGTIAPRSGAQVRISKAVRGDLSGVLTYSGDVRAKGQVAVVPRIASGLDRLYVEVGSRVKEGEPLAELNRSEAEVQVLQTQAAQAAAEAKLAQLKAEARPEAVAQAEANLKVAQARFQALESTRASTDTATLQKRVDDARAALQTVEAARAANQQAMAQAEEAAVQARQRLAQMLADPQRANERALVDSARQAVERAEATIQQTRVALGSQASIDTARRDVQDAEQALAFARLSLNAFDLDQAKAMVEAAEAQLKLVSAPASPDQIKAAEAAVEGAFALAELARMRLRDATVTAPIAGIVAEVHASVGAMVGPTAPLLTLIPPDLEVVIQAEESQVGQLAAGQSAAITVDAFPQDSFTGVVKNVAPVLDPRTRTVSVKVDIPDPQGKLRPNMFAQVAIQAAQRKGAVLVPREAVVRIQDGPSVQTSVFQVIESRVRRQRVLLGAQDARSVEVVQGLSEGMDVVLSPRQDLLDGELISPLESR